MNESLKKQGMFSWNELMTKDVEAAKSFYGDLLGWKYEEQGMPDGKTYHIIKAGEQMIGGIMAQCEQTKAMPPAWGPYVTVDDVDAMVAKSESLGAKILLPPQDIPDTGRFAVIEDPQGAPLSLITYTDV